MRIPCKFAVSIFMIFLLLACERSGRPYAGANATDATTPDYSVWAQRATVAGISHIEAVAPKAPTSGPDGAALYVANCAACHQLTGQGVPGAFPPLDNSRYVAGDNSERLAAIMLYGLVGPITVNKVVYNNAMAPLGKTLNDQQLAAVAAYIRSSWSNKAGPVDQAVFANTRAKYGERSMFQISELGEETG